MRFLKRSLNPKRQYGDGRRGKEKEKGFLNIELRLSPVLSDSHKKAASEPTVLVSYEYFIVCLKLSQNSFTAQKHLFGLWSSLQAHGDCLVLTVAMKSRWLVDRVI